MSLTPNIIDLYPLRTQRAYDADRGADPEYCVLCGKALTGKRRLIIHLVDGGLYAIPASQYYCNPPAEMGWWSIGADCARKLPADYTTPTV